MTSLAAPRRTLSSRQVNLLLEALIAVALTTGIASWLVTTALARPLTVAHAVSGVAMLLVSPLKARGSVVTGFRRGRVGRWISAAFGMILVAVIVLGVVHSTGLWYGVGTWSPLWWHLLLGFSAIPFVVWHVLARPVRPTRHDLSRRAFISAASVTGVAAVTVGLHEAIVGITGLDGADRAATGSHEIGSFDPAAMPVVSWINDRTPAIPAERWQLTIDGRAESISELTAAAQPLVAWLDCTGGWRSRQRWDVVPLRDVARGDSRSIRVTSATGYSRIFGRDDEVFVCVGYDGGPLRRGHGAPVRIVAPGRRGPWWVKWVDRIDSTDRPAWFQLPLPPT